MIALLDPFRTANRNLDALADRLAAQLAAIEAERLACHFGEVTDVG